MNLSNENEKSVSVPLLIGALVLSLVFAVGSSMGSVRRMFNSNTEERKILAKAFADYNGKVFVVFKIKTNVGIELEIYEKDLANNNQQFKQRFPLNDDVEAYLMVNDNSMNLGLVDIDNDGQMDIIAPTVDKNGNSRLNVFQYNNDLNSFVPYVEGAP
ncbi:hypothetical protein CIK05_15110 [Bdellovibrio sp. qaytius]|nr:hypothetical protein CIK05_15110 [Bdellovibrio sp. qaytius]